VQHLLDGYGGLAPVERLEARLRVALAVTIVNVRRILFASGVAQQDRRPDRPCNSTVEEGVLWVRCRRGRLHARKDIGDHAFVDIADVERRPVLPRRAHEL
jgi:hypothetical protein